MPTIATIIVVLLSVCSITAAARAELSTCKQCRDQQQACAKNYSAKTCKTEYGICMKSCQKNSRISQPIPGDGSVEAGKRSSRTQGLVALAVARACHRAGKTMTKNLMTLAVALASLPAIASVQDARSQAPPYCFDLSRVVDLAITKEKFASIAGRPRQGSYVGTSLVLAGWKGCSLYGAATYTCDSPQMDTAEEAEKARAAILDQVKACLGAGWAEAAERSSPNYVVLHDAVRPVAITLSTDQTDNKKHVVRLIVFVRR